MGIDTSQLGDLIGLRVLAWPKVGQTHQYGEVTGVEGADIYVLLDGETEPRRFYWMNVRPA